MSNRSRPSAPRATAARDRAVGALVGLAVGDAVGTTLEFARPGSFTPVDDLVGGGPFGLRAGEWTDDTSMAMCLAESILDTDALDPADQLRRYVAWYRHGYWSSTGHCFDIGSTTRSALDRFTRTGAVTDEVIDQESAANGSLMRLAPVPIRWSADPALAAEKGAAASRTTHPAGRPVDACRVAAAMIAALIGGTPWDEVTTEDFWSGEPLDPRIAHVVRGSWRRAEPSRIRGTGYVVDALEAALWAVDGATGFRDAVLRAANLGDDADTTAAIAGQFAGARWGASAIPASWRDRLVAGPRIATIAGRLHDRATQDATSEQWELDDDVHAYWVEPGRILAGEYPGDPAPDRALAKIDLLVDAGIRTFVDLTDDPHLRPYDDELTTIAARRGLHLQRIARPIPDMGTVGADDYARTVATIRAATDEGGVYLHCWGGIGRTATVAGCLLVERGRSAPAALDRIATLRASTRKAHLPAPQTDAQCQAITDFAQRLGS